MENPGMGWRVEEDNEKSGENQIEYDEEIGRDEFVFQYYTNSKLEIRYWLLENRIEDLRCSTATLKCRRNGNWIFEKAYEIL
jgi:hypothetical protein